MKSKNLLNPISLTILICLSAILGGLLLLPVHLSSPSLFPFRSRLQTNGKRQLYYEWVNLPD